MRGLSKVKLGDVCTKASSSIAQKDLEGCDGIYPIYGASGLIKYVDFYKQDKPYIAVVKDGAGIGRVMLLPAKSSVIGTMQYIIPNSNVNVSYLSYALEKMNLAKYYTGATIPHIYFKDYCKEKLPNHTSFEQQQIADTLDKVSDLIAKRKQQLEKLDLLVKSRFVEMFGDFKTNNKNWNILSFDDFASIDTKMVNDFEKYLDYPHIGIDSIEKHTGNLKGYRTVKEDNVISGKYLFTPQHIIYSKIRPNLNKVALPNFYGVCSADAYPILVNKLICNRIFLAYTMRSLFFLDYILSFSDRTNLPKVNKEQVRGFKSPIPPLELQNQFADFVTATEQQKEKIKKSLETLETLKASLMQKYFG